jgi:hypothetical protein
MPRSQTLNICSNREVCEGQEDRPGHILQHPNCKTQYFLVSTPSIQAHPTAVQPVHTQSPTVRPDPMLAGHMHKFLVQKLVSPSRYDQEDMGPVSIGTSYTRCKTWNVWDKALSYAGFSIPLLSFLFLLPDTWVLMSWESLGLIVSTKRRA